MSKSNANPTRIETGTIGQPNTSIFARTFAGLKARFSPPLTTEEKLATEFSPKEVEALMDMNGGRVESNTVLTPAEDGSVKYTTRLTAVKGDTAKGSGR